MKDNNNLLITTGVYNIDLENSSFFNEIPENQPDFHLRKKGCCDKYFSCFFSKLDLTRLEIKRFNTVKNDNVLLYDLKNSNHEKILEDLFVFLWGKDQLKSDSDRLADSKWKTIGFQA